MGPAGQVGDCVCFRRSGQGRSFSPLCGSLTVCWCCWELCRRELSGLGCREEIRGDGLRDYIERENKVGKFDSTLVSVPKDCFG